MWQVLNYAISATVAIVGMWFGQRGDKRQRQSETFQRLQWAVNLTMTESPINFHTGVAALQSLHESRLVPKEDERFVASMLREAARRSEPVQEGAS